MPLLGRLRQEEYSTPLLQRRQAAELRGHAELCPRRFVQPGLRVEVVAKADDDGTAWRVRIEDTLDLGHEYAERGLCGRVAFTPALKGPEGPTEIRCHVHIRGDHFCKTIQRALAPELQVPSAEIQPQYELVWLQQRDDVEQQRQGNRDHARVLPREQRVGR